MEKEELEKANAERISALNRKHEQEINELNSFLDQLREGFKKEKEKLENQLIEAVSKYREDTKDVQ